MYCEKCRVKVRSSSKICPLCQNELTGEPAEDIFPEIEYIKKGRRFYKILVFIMLVAAVASVIINFNMPGSGYWSIFVIGGFFSFGASFSLLINKRKNVYKTILWQVALLSVITVLWDVFTGFRGWSTEFVIPIMSTVAMIAMAIIAQVTRLNIDDYIIYLIIDSIFAIVPIVLVVTGINNITLPSTICLGVSIISLGALMIFEGKYMRAEMRRRTHL